MMPLPPAATRVSWVCLLAPGGMDGRGLLVLFESQSALSPSDMPMW